MIIAAIPPPREVVPFPSEGAWGRFWRLLGWVRAPFMPMSVEVHPVHALIFADGLTPVRVVARGYGHLTLLSHRLRVDGHLEAELVVPASAGHFVAVFRGFHTVRARGHIQPTDALRAFATPVCPAAQILPAARPHPVPVAPVTFPDWDGAGLGPQAPRPLASQGFAQELRSHLAGRHSAYQPPPPAEPLRTPSPDLKPPPCPPTWSPDGH